MSRHLVVINSTADRERAARYVALAPFGTRLELKASKRTLPQNDCHVVDVDRTSLRRASLRHGQAHARSVGNSFS